MRRLVYLNATLDDLDAIFRYVAGSSASIKVGQRFVGLLRRQCARLASLPLWAGHDRSCAPISAASRSTAT